MNSSRRSFLQTSAALVASATSARPAANDRITIGMIGTGARATELMEAIQQHPQAEIVAVVDAYTGRVERAIERTSGRAKPFATHHELLSRGDIDAVVVATPDHWHKQIIIEAVRAGKDVYSEKPLTYKASEGNEIIAEARKHERIVQVGSQGISSATQLKAKEIIQSGRLGQITMIRAAYNRNTASGAWIYPIPPDASPRTVNWEMFLGPAPKRPFNLERFFRWRCYEDYSGGIATDLFVHLCTTIHFLMDAKMPSRAVALGELYRWKESREVPDTINAVLEYPEGFAVNLSSTFNNEQSAESGFHIMGSEGSLMIGWDGLTYYPENAVEDNRWIVKSWAKKAEDNYWRDPQVIASEIAPKKRAVRKPEKFAPQGPEATVAHFGHFFDSVRTRKPYWEDAGAGHRAAACAHMVNAAAKQKRMVEWDFETGDLRA